MEAIQMIKERRSVRKYKAEKVSKELVNEILEVSRWSPSWANFQVARYTVVQSEELIKRIAEEGVHGFSYNVGTLANAQNVMVLSYKKGKSGKLSETEYATGKGNAWEMFDAGLACQTFCLAAHAKGIGTCIFGVIDDAAISKIVDLPADETVASIITFGYPDECPKETPRHAVEKIARFL